MGTLYLPFIVGAVVMVALSAASADQSTRPESGIDLAQVPKWMHTDLDFFLHGSMSTEVVPEEVLRAFITTYPDLFPNKDLSNFGAIPDAGFAWPVGFSRRNVPHLGRMPSIGINCASCHVGEIHFGADTKPLRVLGMTAQFDPEAFFGAVIVATFRTQEPANMEKFLAGYGKVSFEPDAIERHHAEILAAIKEDPTGAKGAGPGGLQDIAPDDLRSGDMTVRTRALLKLFHNMRVALHIPDQPPPASPPNGPGRNDPWRILSYSLLGIQTKPA